MKADMVALKDQMAFVMEAMLSMKRLRESNATTVVAASVAVEADYWISPVVTFWSTFSLYKYVQGKFGLLESAPDRQVFKIKTDESEYRTQGTSLRQGKI